MRQFLIFCLLSLLLCASASSQTFSVPPSPGAVLIGTFPIGFTYNQSTGGVTLGEAKVSSTSSAYTVSLVGVFRTTSGKNDYMIATDSIKFSGSDEAVDQFPTAKIYEYLSLAAVGRGIELGYTNCAATTSSNPKVYAEVCVARMGSGVSTRFVPCDRTTFSAREYAVTCPAGPGAPQITVIPGAGTSCTSGYPCEATNPPGGGGTIN